MNETLENVIDKNLSVLINTIKSEYRSLLNTMLAERQQLANEKHKAAMALLQIKSWTNYITQYKGNDADHLRSVIKSIADIVDPFVDDLNLESDENEK